MKRPGTVRAKVSTRRTIIPASNSYYLEEIAMTEKEILQFPRTRLARGNVSEESPGSTHFPGEHDGASTCRRETPSSPGAGPLGTRPFHDHPFGS